ncbi:sulfotransferase family protein [Candidatus Sumerlaeota bacterium]|nr:sulfotransferase family protein [Candidatus Sumerlaeota bacterium]
MPLGSLFRRVRFGPAVIVVSGLPRSGTSMMMKMLVAGGIEAVTDAVRQADEDNPKGYFEYEPVKTLDKPGADKSWVRNARGKAVKVISFLLRDLPRDNRYQVIFMQRDMSEILASQRKMEIRREETGSVPDGDMAAHYDRHLREVRYLLENDTRFDLLEVEHRSAIEDAVGTARRVREFLGLPLDEAKMAAEVDRSLYRNRPGTVR